jgi:hypothetical protein
VALHRVDAVDSSRSRESRCAATSRHSPTQMSSGRSRGNAPHGWSSRSRRTLFVGNLRAPCEKMPISVLRMVRNAAVRGLCARELRVMNTASSGPSLRVQHWLSFRSLPFTKAVDAPGGRARRHRWPLGTSPLKIWVGFRRANVRWHQSCSVVCECNSAVCPRTQGKQEKSTAATRLSSAGEWPMARPTPAPIGYGAKRSGDDRIDDWNGIGTSRRLS